MRRLWSTLTTLTLAAAAAALVVVPPPPAVAAPVHAETNTFFTSRYGLFVHYVPGLTVDSSGVVVNDVNQLADSFDAAGFANDVASFGVEYVMFTAWHKAMIPLYPSAKMAQWRGPGKSSNRDVLGDMIDAVRAKGIPVLFYTHPNDGHDMSNDDMIATGWGDGGGGAFGGTPNPATFDKARWNNFVNDIYAEMLDRYATRISGLYFDAARPNVTDYRRLERTVRSHGGNLVTMQNYYGNVVTTQLGDKENPAFVPAEGDTWPAYATQVVSEVVGGGWWAKQKSGNPAVRLPAEAVFRYTVLQAGTNTVGGGVKWAAGPYAGGGWETGVAPMLRQVNAYLAPVTRSVKNTFPSESWPTADQATIDSLSWGVATRSPDATHTYVHVLKPPTGATLNLPAPADGRRFANAALLVDGRPVALTQDAAGVHLTLPAGAAWSSVDTVLDLTTATLATGRAVSATSSVEDGTWGLARAVDGRTGPQGWSSESSLFTNHAESVTVDLGAPAGVSEVVLSPRTDGVNTGYGFPVDLTVQTSTDRVTWTTRVSRAGLPRPGAEGTALTFTQATARYVRVTGTSLRANPNDGGRYRMQFAEIGVAAAPVSGSRTLVNQSHRRLLQDTGESYLGLPGVTAVAGTPATSPNSAQNWTVQDAGGGYLRLVNATGRVLTGTGDPYQGRTDVNRVAEGPATGADDQLWQLRDAGGGWYTLVNKRYDRQLHLTADQYLDRVDVNQVALVPTSWNTAEQRWSIR
ncbi:discoidin domain-containing protein [Micromonospora mirobrigensis]|uniref:Alpha-L-fucosidase C-terminal domain-containing protein n=1 Tax=Micromonospora mirobrigensis TaxID=262898 RepID=A0A1C4YYS0_9ACTN|nr:discoidin domain-containing protein [Micromonospora mirobrigensis]SCF25883.1 Alpha-L-fucosidase C-terminal domain-containing protein [Micromonospora mirobrigensis]